MIENKEFKGIFSWTQNKIKLRFKKNVFNSLTTCKDTIKLL